MKIMRVEVFDVLRKVRPYDWRYITFYSKHIYCIDDENSLNTSLRRLSLSLQTNWYN